MVCLACAGPGASRCPLDGSLIAARVLAGSCPAGLHAIRNARVRRWLGLRWDGAPAPWRVWLYWRHGLDWDGVMDLPGCGCLIALKRLWRCFRAGYLRHVGRDGRRPCLGR